MKKIYLLVMTGFLVSCADVPVSDIPETVRQGVYAETDAIHKGRYDLAEQYGDNLLRIVPAPKVRLSFKAVLAPLPAPQNAPKGTPATFTPVNIAPLDASKTTLSFIDASDLLSTPGAVAAQAQADNFGKLVDVQQAVDAKQKADAVAQVQKDKTELAASAKWKYMVFTAIGIFLAACIVYVAWKLKWL